VHTCQHTVTGRWPSNLVSFVDLPSLPNQNQRHTDDEPSALQPGHRVAALLFARKSVGMKSS
jgi:hypothetical protein